MFNDEEISHYELQERIKLERKLEKRAQLWKQARNQCRQLLFNISQKPDSISLVEIEKVLAETSSNGDAENYDLPIGSNRETKYASSQ